jgi:hypothetical protein
VSSPPEHAPPPPPPPGPGPPPPPPPPPAGGAPPQPPAPPGSLASLSAGSFYQQTAAGYVSLCKKRHLSAYDKTLAFFFPVRAWFPHCVTWMTSINNPPSDLNGSRISRDLHSPSSVPFILQVSWLLGKTSILRKSGIHRDTHVPPQQKPHSLNSQPCK